MHRFLDYKNEFQQQLQLVIAKNAESANLENLITISYFSAKKDSKMQFLDVLLHIYLGIL